MSAFPLTSGHAGRGPASGFQPESLTWGLYQVVSLIVAELNRGLLILAKGGGQLDPQLFLIFLPSRVLRWFYISCSFLTRGGMKGWGASRPHTRVPGRKTERAKGRGRARSAWLLQADREVCTAGDCPALGHRASPGWMSPAEEGLWVWSLS